MIQAGMSKLADTYRRYPLTITKGEGCYLYDDQGKRYLDLISGIAVCSLGHCHPEITKVIKEQAETLLHVSNLFWTIPQIELAEKLTKFSGLNRVFYCNSGTEAVEAALKLARKYGNLKFNDKNKNKIIAFEGSFHGRTMGSLTLTGQEVYRKDFYPLLPGVEHIPANNFKALESSLDEQTVAIILEPIQGEGGVRLFHHDYLYFLSELCKEREVLIILDEVQVGLGRTGYMFAYEDMPIKPDILCLAKALGNGFPIGAMLAKEEIMAYFTPGSHASTFGGNPLACAVANKVVDIIGNPQFLKTVRDKGNYFIEKLKEISQKSKIITEIRGKGLIIGVEFNTPQTDLVKFFIDRGILVLLSHERILRLIPPLIIEYNDMDYFLQVYDEYLNREGAK